MSEIKALCKDAEAAGNVSVHGYALILIGSRTTDQGHALASLEKALSIFKSNAASEDDIELAEFGIAMRLLDDNEYARSLPCFARVLDHDPLHPVARQNFVAILFRLKEWRRAATFLEHEIELFGELPGILFGLGRALFELGEFGAALEPLNRAALLAGDDESLRKHAEDFRTRAISSGGMPPKPSALRAPIEPMTREELAKCLTDFCAVLKGEKRMTFWRSDGAGGHKWTEKPESVAQDALHFFLKARLGSRVHVFEEVGAGAGRVDIFLVGEGGFAAILELKMLGAPYSSTYAFSGTEQIAHYMDARACHIGHLVILDARIRDFGTGLADTVNVNSSTISVSFADVRPEVKPRAGD